METSMTLSIHWDDARHDALVATKARARQAALRVLKVLATAAGFAALLTAIVAIRIYAYLPTLH